MHKPSVAEIWKTILISLDLPPENVEVAVLRAESQGDSFQEVTEWLESQLAEDTRMALDAPDYWALCSISVLEAGFGVPQDQTDVAVSVINRFNAGIFGGTVSDVIYAPKQYQPMFPAKQRIQNEEDAVDYIAWYRGVSTDFAQKEVDTCAATFADSELWADSVAHVGGRTDFKGLSQVKNRVAKEDPMRTPKSNYFHISPATQTYAMLDSYKEMQPTGVILK